MNHILKDIDHLLENGINDSVEDEDFVGLADPGSLSPGSLSMLETYQENTGGNIHPREQAGKNLYELRRILGEGSNINTKRSRSPEPDRSITRKSPNFREREQLENLARDNPSDFPCCDVDFDEYISNPKYGEYPLWDSPNRQSLVEVPNEKFTGSSSGVKTLDGIEIPRRKRSSLRIRELNSSKRHKSREPDNEEPHEYVPPTAQNVFQAILGRNSQQPAHPQSHDKLQELVPMLDEEDDNPQPPDKLQELMRMLDEEDDDLQYEILSVDEYDGKLCNRHEVRESRKRPNSPDNYLTKELENIIDKSEKLLPRVAYDKINNPDIINAASTSNTDLFKKADERGKNTSDPKTLAYVSSTSEVLRLYNLNPANNTDKSKSKGPMFNELDSYVLEENQSQNLSVNPRKRLQLSEREISDPLDQMTNKVKMFKIGPNLKIKSRKLKKVVDVENVQEEFTCTKRHSATSSSLSTLSNDNWREKPYSDILQIAIPYINKPIPLDWKKMSNPRLIGACMTIFSKLQMLEVWNIINTNSINDIQNIRIWSPIQYLDDHSKSYNRYFPIVMEKSTQNLLAFDYKFNLDVNDIDRDSKKQGWTIMPSLDWIKSNIFTRIIAANDGLFVLDSVKPAPSTIHINYKKMLHENKNYSNNVYEINQSLLTIINPLTHEYLLLPPIPFNEFKEKIGYLSFSNSKEKHYQLFILGSSKLLSPCNDITGYNKIYKTYAQQKRPTYIVHLAIYSSLNKGWIFFDSFENTIINFPHLGGSVSCAVINYSLYFGGIKVDIQSETRSPLEMASIFYINCSTSRMQQIIQPFLLHGIVDIDIPEPPKVLRVANNRLFAVTRETSKNIKNNTNQLFLIEILLNEDGTPNGSYAPVENGIMPKIYVNKLFQRIPGSHQKISLIYEVCSSGDLIAFKVSFPLFVLYDVHKSRWRLTYYERDSKIGQKPNYLLVEGVYQPDWLAIT